MKEFSYYLTINAVKKQTPDMHLARATAKDCLDRIELAKALIKTQKPKYVVENAYESVRELIDAILYAEGYKSYSHEASIAYLEKLGFSIKEIMDVDRLRKKRNGIKYYGEASTKEEAEETITIAEEMIKKLSKKNPDMFK